MTDNASGMESVHENSSLRFLPVVFATFAFYSPSSACLSPWNTLIGLTLLPPAVRVPSVAALAVAPFSAAVTNHCNKNAYISSACL